MRALSSCRQALGFELVGELAELVEIDTGPEAERMRHGPRQGATTRLLHFAKSGADRSIDGLLERDALFTRTLLQEPREVVVNSEGRAHQSIMDAT
jgi:hypothetical protein